MEATCLQNITLVWRARYLEVLASEQLGKRGMVVDDSRGIFDGCYGDGQRKIRGRMVPLSCSGGLPCGLCAGRDWNTYGLRGVTQEA
jgi:hypothetical protein